MPTVDIVRSSPIENTYRVAKIQGMFDIPHSSSSEFRIKADLPITAKPWKLGLITGASGSGKSTIARHLFPIAENHQWSAASLVDDFPERLS